MAWRNDTSCAWLLFLLHSILLTAGDVSGDVHTAALARALLARNPDLTLHTLGGRRLQAAAAPSPGGIVLGDTTDCSAIGIISAGQVYLRCRKLRTRLLEFLNHHHVDAAVLCDWGAFNGSVLSDLRAHGIPVLYYFPPRSWQRTGSPGLGIVPYVNRVATPFEWSAARLRAAGCRAEWVGHPSLERVAEAEKREVLRKRFGVGPDEKLIALMPGSRRSELSVLAPKMAQAAALLQAQHPRLRVIAVLPQEMAAAARASLPQEIPVVTDCALELLIAADAAIVKTGTANLEAVLAGAPHVTVYDGSVAGRIEWLLLWAWKRIPFYSMPNIILQRKAVPELLGLNSTPEKIAAALTPLLDDTPARRQMLADYRLIRKALGSELPVPPTERTAQLVEEMLRETARRPEVVAAV